MQKEHYLKEIKELQIAVKKAEDKHLEKTQVTSDKKRSKSKRQSSVKKIEQFYSEDMDELKKLRHKEQAWIHKEF